METKHYPNPGVSAVLSFLITGLGQIYNGQIKKGLFLMFISAVFLTICIIGAIVIGFWLYNPMTMNFTVLVIWTIIFVLSIVVITSVGIYNIYDAYYQANSSNEPSQDKSSKLVL